MEDVFDAIAAGKPAQDLVCGDVWPLDAGLPMTYVGVYSNVIVRFLILRDIQP